MLDVKLLIKKTISKLPKTLALSLNNPIVMMFKLEAIVIGVTTFTMEALVKTQIALNPKSQIYLCYIIFFLLGQFLGFSWVHVTFSW